MENFQQCSKPKNKTFIFNIIIIELSCLSFVYGCAQQDTRCLSCKIGLVHCWTCDCDGCIKEYNSRNYQGNDPTPFVCNTCGMRMTSRGMLPNSSFIKCFQCLERDEEINAGEGGAGGRSGDEER
jgi:hypothetical protein